jgi:hypothetical protein
MQKYLFKKYLLILILKGETEAFTFITTSLINNFITLSKVTNG